jgi:hypothetical protein
VLTPWLTVLGKNVEGMPLLEVTLRRAGDELKGVKAWVSSSRHTGSSGSYAARFNIVCSSRCKKVSSRYARERDIHA